MTPHLAGTAAAVLLAVILLPARVTADTCITPGDFCPLYCGPGHAPHRRQGFPQPPAGLTPIQSHVWIRHGSRSQASGGLCWSGDTSTLSCTINRLMENSNFSSAGLAELPRVYRKVYIANREAGLGDCGLGHLLPEGYDAQKHNGEKLRDAYVGPGRLLPTTATPADVYLRSTDVPRTIASGQALFDALLPGPGPENAACGLQEVTWNVVDSSTDDLGGGYAPICPRLSQLRDEFDAGSQFQQIVQQYTWLMNDIMRLNKSKTLADTIANFPHFFDCTMVHTCNNQPWLPGFTETMANATLNAATAIEAARNAYGDVAKLAIGTVVGDMRTRMQSMVSTPGSRPRFVLYSAHDSTLFPLLNAALVAFETFKNASSGAYFVRMVYRDQPVPVPGCPAAADNLCPFATFMAVTANMVPTDTDCNMVVAPTVAPTPAPTQPCKSSSSGDGLTVAEAVGVAFACLVAGAIGATALFLYRQRASGKARFSPLRSDYAD